MKNELPIIQLNDLEPKEEMSGFEFFKISIGLLMAVFGVFLWTRMMLSLYGVI